MADTLKKPTDTPRDLWRTCDDVQRQWIINEDAKEQEAERLRNRIAVTLARRRPAPITPGSDQ